MCFFFILILFCLTLHLISSIAWCFDVMDCYSLNDATILQWNLWLKIITLLTSELDIVHSPLSKKLNLFIYLTPFPNGFFLLVLQIIIQNLVWFMFENSSHCIEKKSHCFSDFGWQFCYGIPLKRLYFVLNIGLKLPLEFSFHNQRKFMSANYFHNGHRISILG